LEGWIFFYNFVGLLGLVGLVGFLGNEKYNITKKLKK
jgi:hypothetical protein